MSKFEFTLEKSEYKTIEVEGEEVMSLIGFAVKYQSPYVEQIEALQRDGWTIKNELIRKIE